MRLLPSRIAMRIPIGFGLMLVIALVIGAVGFFNIIQLADSFRRYETVRSSTTLVTNAAILFGELRGQADVYVVSGEREDADRFNDLALELRNELAVIAQEVDGDTARGLASSLLMELDNYEGNFAMTTSAVSMRDNARNQMDRQGQEMADGLTAAVARLIQEYSHQDAAYLGQVHGKLMQALLESTRMRVSYSQQGMDKAKASFADLQQAVTDIGRQLGDPVAYEAMGTFSKGMEDYTSAFERSLAQAARLQDVGRGAGAQIAQTIAGQMQQLVEAQGADMATERDHAFETVTFSQMVIAGAAGIALLLGIALAVLTTRSLVPPLRALTQALRRLAERDWTTDVPGLNRKDELGEIAQTVAVFKESGIEADRMTDGQVAEARAKQLRQEKIEQAIALFEKAVGNALGSLSGSAAALNDTARGMSDLAEETSGRATAVAAAAEQASANVQTVAASSEELYASVEEIGRQVASSTEIAEQASHQAEAAGGKVQSLAEAAERIGAVVQLISDIAGQTNLLALNATIESARAGEAGKGFAVVASEVKNLANQTANATKDIRVQIEQIQAASREAVDTIKAIADVVQSLEQMNTAVASAVEEQGATTEEIARNTQEAAAGAGQVTDGIARVSAASVKTGEEAGEVLTMCGDLAASTKALEQEVSSFVGSIRSGQG